MPPAIQILSYAIDGVSLITTNRSISDHALSGVMKRDCSMFRFAKGEEVCQDEVDVATVAHEWLEQDALQLANNLAGDRFSLSTVVTVLRPAVDAVETEAEPAFVAAAGTSSEVEDDAEPDFAAMSPPIDKPVSVKPAPKKPSPVRRAKAVKARGPVKNKAAAIHRPVGPRS
ncbi:MAG: hypothetical protein EXQ85_03855 [Alphaproteobacteria bacterium]|nr:hypothetical protein [Alphaproteobacteria bacterium]